MPVSPELGAGVKTWERDGVAGMRGIVAWQALCSATLCKCQTMSVTPCALLGMLLRALRTHWR